MLRRSLTCLLLCALAISVAAQKKAKPNYMKKPGETAVAAEVPKSFVAAAQPCDNYAWAAAVEMLLKQKQVATPQRDWVMKAYGGYKCISPLAAQDYASLVRYLNDDYALTPSRRVRIEAEFSSGAPTSSDPFIAAFRAGEPVMLVWRGKAYVWYGAVYDEYVHPNGNRMFELLELKLLDPLAKTKEAQAVSFVKGKDDPNQIDGVMWVRVTAR